MFPALTPAQWVVVSAEFPELASATSAERERRLDELASADPTVVQELRSLLAAADRDDGRMDRVAEQALTDWQASRGAPFLGRSIGPWTITGEIGRGGMGVVYEGVRVDGEFDQRVAIKTLALAVHRPELLWRFRRERKILATLSHPNITALFDGGATDDGVPYLVMEHVDGVRLDTWCDEQRLSIRARLDLFRTVCAAVQYAHGKLVVHRDLKPSNILVTRDGVVKLLDFGVAKLLSDETDALDGLEMTRSGMAPLTTGYASPEQVRGESITTATDVYALGVLLFRLLTGTSPFALDGKSAAEAREVISGSAPRLPSESVVDTHARTTTSTPDDTTTSQMRGLLRGELDAIVLMALRKEPTRRYATVQALSDDVLRYLKGEPVSARPERLSYTVRAFVRRNRGLSLAAACAVFALLAGTVVSTWQANRATAAALRANRVRRLLESVLSAGDPNSWVGIRAGGGDVSLRVVLDSAVPRVAIDLHDEPETRAELYRNFAASYLQLDQLPRAKQLIDSARALHRGTVGDRTFATALDEFVAAAVAGAMGDKDEAVRVLASLRVQAATEPVTRDSLGSMIVMTLAQDRMLLNVHPDTLRQLAAEALTIERARPQPRVGILAVAQGLLAVAEAQRGDSVASDSLIVAARRDAATVATSYPATPVFATAFAATAMYWRGALPAAEGYGREAYRTAVRLYGERHPLTAQLQMGLSWTLLDLGQLPEGRALADAALATQLARPSRDRSALCALYRLQMAYALAARDTVAALAAQRQAEAMLDGTGSEQPFLDSYLQYATAALAMQRGDTLAAWQALARGARVMREGPGPAHPLTMLAAGRLAAFSARMGRDGETGAVVGGGGRR